MGGMPSISITFTELAATAVARGERGIIAMILKDATVPETNPAICVSNEDIPKELSADNQEQIKLALMGYVNTPLRVVVYVLPEDAEDYSKAFQYLRTVKFNYLVCPTVETDGHTEDVVSYIKTERESNKWIKAVLPHTKGDNEGIINYTTEKVYVGEEAYTAEQYCSRIAGIIAGTPLSISCTYAPLTELTDCTRLDKKAMDKAVEAGELIVWWDGEKVKTGRGVNSLVTLTQEKKTQFQKIKIVDATDMIADDIRMTAEDNYIGKYANSYDNKCLLISAIGNYFDKLVEDDVIESYEIGIDIKANRSYLRDRGEDVDSMSDDKIKKANTGSHVYLTCNLVVLDAIEDIDLPISI